MNNAMKRIGAMLLIMVLLFSLSACTPGVVNTSLEKEIEPSGVKTITLSSKTTAKEDKAEPVVYIYHTHAFETYYGGESVVDIGKALTDCLSETYGITVIHDTSDYSKESKPKAYDAAYKGLQTALENNPEITHFLDIHRDAGHAQSTRINGKIIAPVSFAVGKGVEYKNNEKPNYEKNYAFAKLLYEKMAERSVSLVTPISEKDGRYNQHMPGTCALINVGYSENEFAEAKAAIPYLAEAIANAIKVQ